MSALFWPGARRHGQERRFRLLPSRRALAIPGALAVILGLGLSVSPPALAATSHPVPSGLTGTDWTAVPGPARVVALTFDAGANADGVASILSTLTSQHVPATFMLTGAFTKAFPGQARAIVAAGQRVGDHSMTHPYFTKLTDAQMRSQVLDAENEIVSVTGADPWPWFRFPYGDVNAHAISVVNSVGFVPVRWTVDTLGWEGTSGGITVQTVVNRVLANLQPGEIVLMHCGSNPDDHSTLDANALPTVISELKARGYSFVTLDGLLGYRFVLSGGKVMQYGTAPFGSLGTQPAGVSAVGIAADHATGGYWVLKSNGGVKNFGAPWSGSLAGHLPAGTSVTAIAAGRGGGYYVLTSDGGVHNYGATWRGSLRGKLPAGVKAVGLATDPATGGYWVLKSNGGVVNFAAPWYGSLAGRLPAGQQVRGIAGQ